MPQPTLQDFSVVNTHVRQIQQELALRDSPSAFYFLALDLILRLQRDEIDDSITDNKYLSLAGRPAGHDRGVDALYIDGSTNPATVHIFNCKYVDALDRTDRNFPASETDKLLSFLGSLMQQDGDLATDVNAALYAKVEEIWALFRDQVPVFQIHLCSNLYREMEQREDARLRRELARYSHVSLHYHLMAQFVSLLTRRDKVQVDARFHADSRLLFERSDGDIRALVLSIGSRDLLRIVSADASLRANVDLEDSSALLPLGLLEDAFEDNVRVYLKEKSKINRNIKETALSEVRPRFFYFNNGVTITCSRFEFPRTRFPIVTITNLQIVNGGQTVHALYDAFRQNPAALEQIDVLCRIYETTNAELSTNIAEYTNSQNPVTTRDIRSNDFLQKKLETELLAMDYYYERKRNQYSGKPVRTRIDSERAGQALLAFYNEMPGEAKDKKGIIFADKYDEVFADDIDGRKVLLAVGLLDLVDDKRILARNQMTQSPQEYEKESFVLHANYYFLYTIKRLAVQDGVDLATADAAGLIAYYPKAKSQISAAVRKERALLNKQKENYSHRVFFKGSRPKMHIDAALKSRTAR